MEIDPVVAKEISEAAKPYVDFILQEKVFPKIEKFILKSKNKAKNLIHAKSKSEDYCYSLYEKSSVVHTLAFRNQDKKLEDIYQPLTIRSDINDEEYLIENEYCLPNHRILIVDCAGMGKSVLSKKIALNCINNKKGLPILVELRNINSEIEIDEFIFKQLNFSGKLDAKIIGSLPELVILDGFDEVLPENHEIIIERINAFSIKYPKIPIVLTSREESVLTGLLDFKRYRINELKIEESFELLQRYSDNKTFTRKMINAVQAEVSNVGDFLGTPLYVSLLYCAYMYKNDIPLKRHLFYSQVYDALFSGHDLTKSQGFTRPKKSKLDSGDFHTVLRQLAFKSLQKGMIIEYSTDELRIVIDEIGSNLPHLSFNSSSFIDDLLTSVPLFLRDGPCIKWNHKSLMEYFSARFICHDIGENRNEVIGHIYKSSKLYSYLNILSLIADIDYRFIRNQILLSLFKELLAYIQKFKNTITNRRISEADKDVRACYTFQRNIILYFDDEKPTRISISNPFNKMNDLIKEMGFGEFSQFHGNTGFFSSWIMMGMNETNQRQVLSIGLLKEKDCLHHKNTLEDDQINGLEIEKQMSLPIGKIIEINDNRKSDINNSRNFSLVNSILNIFEPRSNLVISEKDLEKIIRSIEEDKMSDKSYLLSGI